MTDVVRCVRCKLNQYWTKNGLCRRCNTPFPKIPNPVSILDAHVIPIEKLRAEDSVRIIRENLYAYRTMLGLTQTAFGKRVGMAHGNISRIESSSRGASLSCLERLAEGLGLPINWLMEPITADRFAELFAREVLLATRRSGVQLDAVRKLIALQERRAG